MFFCVVEKWKWQVTVTEQQFSWDQNCARYKASVPDPAGLSLYKDAEANNGSEFMRSWKQLPNKNIDFFAFDLIRTIRKATPQYCPDTRDIYPYIKKRSWQPRIQTLEHLQSRRLMAVRSHEASPLNYCGWCGMSDRKGDSTVSRKYVCAHRKETAVLGCTKSRTGLKLASLMESCLPRRFAVITCPVQFGPS